MDMIVFDQLDRIEHKLDKLLEVLDPDPNPTVHETADMLGISTSTVYTWLREGRIEAIKKDGPGVTRIDRKSMEGLI